MPGNSAACWERLLISHSAGHASLAIYVCAPQINGSSLGTVLPTPHIRDIWQRLVTFLAVTTCGE